MHPTNPSTNTTQALLKAESQLRAVETALDLSEAAACQGGEWGGQSDGAAATNRISSSHKAARAAADAVRRRELAGARACRQKAAAVEAERQAVQAKQTVQDRASIAAAATGLRTGRHRLQDDKSRAGAGMSEAAAAVQVEEVRRRCALMALKGNLDGVRHGVAAKAELFQQMQSQKRDLEAREFEELLEAGLNPYAVYRQREAEAAEEKAAAALAASQADRRVKLAAALKAEERQHHRTKQRQQIDRSVEARYQREMGTAAQLARTDAYMRTHTLTHQAVVDPTSRCPQYPSEVVRVVPQSFGMGAADAAVVALVADRLGCASKVDLSASPLLPSAYKRKTPSTAQHISSSGSDLEEERNAADVDDDGGSSGGEGGQVNRHRQGAASSSAWKVLSVRQLSKFEADRLAASKALHRERVTHERSRRQQQEALQKDPELSEAASGSTLPAAAGTAACVDHQGPPAGTPSFVASPPEIVFQDIVAGVRHQRAVTLINRGPTKSSIRLVDVPGEVRVG